MDLVTWLDGGKRERAGGYDLFVREDGVGERHLTFLHGYPTCSWDYAKIWPELSASYRCLAFDFVGFGHSDKPRIQYSFELHLRCLRDLWQARGIERTVLVAHDYGSTCALEVLARHLEGTLPVHLDGVVLMNGGVVAAMHRPRPMQRALRLPWVGEHLVRLTNKRRFAKAFSDVLFVKPSPEELDQFWTSIEREGGRLLLPRLLHYMDDRQTHRERWEATLADRTVPKAFVWGRRDPVSGAHLLEELHRRGTPGAFTELGDAAHYPQWEQPQRVQAAIGQFVGAL